MKRRIYSIMALCLCTVASLQAQDIHQEVKIDSVYTLWEPQAEVRMHIDLSELHVGSDEAIELIPLVAGPADTVELPRVLITSRLRQLLYERGGKYMRPYAQLLRRKNQTEQSVSYQAALPDVPWLDGATLLVHVDRCDCGWRARPDDCLTVTELMRPRRYEPLVTYRMPAREEVKMREMSGQAFLDFPVNKTTIYPEYRNNPRELQKIIATIDAVRNDRYATIRAVTIKGYASPEGSYANNARLAQGRAAALLNHVKSLYQFEGVEFSVTSEPEDWAGLDSLVDTSNLPDKEAILAIVRDASITDPDQRNSALQRLSGGKIYRELLTQYYPALRHSDYTVRYHIRNFTVEEAKQLIYTDPKQLSLEEMYQVAQTYAPGSAEFNEVFEIAVRMYPNDPISNLNAANTALQRQDAVAARHYLQKALPGPEKEQAEKTLAELEDYLKRKNN